MRAMGERSEPSARDGATTKRWARGCDLVEPGCVMEPRAMSESERAISAPGSSLAERKEQLTSPSGVVNI